ncbi:calcitonin gene-related peptide type 1 receptor-like [Ctenocephalides felis]|uniref:calcitonin gene-related peptide type 1 receptor-like n=1 Tax=Ctenocephalides felis TaxID=7515 RepID=UPI000E6E4507|nr:calcitonin gene-related peptide type 1 receptor-like [Ctenocephalides felis]
MDEEYVNGSHLANSQLIQDLKRKVLKCLEMDRALNASQSNTFCPTTFDGYLCWLRSAPGTRSFQNCPDTVLGFDPLRRAHKDCLENGTWFTHPDTGLEWSNYSNCVDMEDLRDATLEVLKKRAERFGSSVSKKLSEAEAKEKLEKRKERFGSIQNTNVTTSSTDVKIKPTMTNAEKAQLRLKRFNMGVK